MHGKANLKPGNPTRGVYSIPLEPPALMVYGHKSQSFMKDGGQQKCLDKALIEHLGH